MGGRIIGRRGDIGILQPHCGQTTDVLLQRLDRLGFPQYEQAPYACVMHAASRRKTVRNLAFDMVAAVGEFGQRIEHGDAIGVHAAMSNQPVVQPTAFIQPRGNHTNLILFATAFLLLCWGAIFWFKTGNVRLALGTVVGANVVGCLLLAGRR